MRNRQFKKPVSSEKCKAMAKSSVVSSVTCRRRVARTSSMRHHVLSSRQIRNCMSGQALLSSRRKNRSRNIKSLIAKKIANIMNKDSGHSRIKSVIASLTPQLRNRRGVCASMRTKASDEIYRLAVRKRAR